jgi:anti-sigma factor RsiW
MNKCTDSDIQEMLPDLLHNALPGDAKKRVEAHLATCESCQEELDIIRTVKDAAIFAPSINVDRVVRQIPPYRTIVPAIEQPARTRMVSWLVAAGVALAVVGGGSAIVMRQISNETGSAVATAPTSPRVTIPAAAATPEPIVRAIASPTTTPSPTHALALVTDVDALSDRNLVQLMNDMDRFDALPNAEPDPVISVDGGDSL